MELHTGGSAAAAPPPARLVRRRAGRQRWWDGSDGPMPHASAALEESFAGMVVDGRWIHFGALSQPVAGASASVEGGADLLRRGRLGRAATARTLSGAAGVITPGCCPDRSSEVPTTCSSRSPDRSGWQVCRRVRMPEPGGSRAGSTASPSTTATGDVPVEALPLEFPFTGRWMAINSPADRVPSHGTDMFGSTYAIDFLAVGDDRRSAPWRWNALLASEPPDRFLGFGAPILAPTGGTIALSHDGEPDHEARRSLFTLVPYLATQQQRSARGAAGVAGNHVVIAVSAGGPFVLLAHLQRRSVRGTGG